MRGKSLLFLVNDRGYFVSHRMPIATAAIEKGFAVHVAYGATDFGDKPPNSSIQYHYVPLARGGLHPFREARSLVSLVQLFRDLRPDLVHLVTLKPVIYGGIAARVCRVPAVVSALAGLGSLFSDNPSVKLRTAKHAVLPLIRLALRHPNQTVIFQNSFDREQILSLTGMDSDRTRLITGSGVDFRVCPYLPEPRGPVTVMMASRLIRDKGVMEFVEAARHLHRRGVTARFVLIGAADPGNPSSVPLSQVDEWRREGVVELLGHRTNVPELFSEANIVVLPSYREGLPKTLLEAAACGRAIITTDVPGCRDAVEPGISALLVPPRDPGALADAIQRLVIDEPLRRAMGQNGREIARKRFAIEMVVSAHLEIYQGLIGA